MPTLADIAAAMDTTSIDSVIVSNITIICPVGLISVRIPCLFFSMQASADCVVYCSNRTRSAHCVHLPLDTLRLLIGRGGFASSLDAPDVSHTLT